MENAASADDADVDDDHEQPSCGVCLEPLDYFDVNVITIACAHQYHKECITEWSDSPPSVPAFQLCLAHAAHSTHSSHSPLASHSSHSSQVPTGYSSYTHMPALQEACGRGGTRVAVAVFGGRTPTAPPAAGSHLRPANPERPRNVSNRATNGRHTHTHACGKLQCGTNESFCADPIK